VLLGSLVFQGALVAPYLIFWVSLAVIWIWRLFLVLEALVQS